MFESVFPVLPALIIAHAWMTIMMLEVMADYDGAMLPPEAYPI